MAQKVLGVAGSLRRASYNRALLHAARELAPPGMEIILFEQLAEIPLFDQDLEARGDPEPVAAFKRAIAQADGLLIATPEYNYGVPGVLKNAIDWASRPPAATPLKGKAAALMGASGGTSGTVRAQLAWRQTFLFTETRLMGKPELLVPRAPDKFEANGNLTDEPTRQRLKKFLEAFAAWIG